MVEVKVCGITNASDARLAVDLGAAMLGFNFYPRSPRYIAPTSVASIVAGLPASKENPRLAPHSRESLGYNQHSSPELHSSTQTYLSAARNLGHPSAVGVFVNATVDEIVSSVAASGVSAVQLHGDESDDFCRELRRRMPWLGVIKAFRTDAKFAPEIAARYPAHSLLVDADCAGFGGSGQQANWDSAHKLAQIVCCESTKVSAESQVRPTNYPTLAKEARVGHPHTMELRTLPRLILAGGLTSDNVAEAICRVQPQAVDVCSGVEAAKGRKSADKLREFFAAVRSASMASSTA